MSAFEDRIKKLGDMSDDDIIAKLLTKTVSEE